MKRRAFWVAAAAVVLCGCGYVGEPMPPLLNIPTRIGDLTAFQRAGRIIVEFSVPQLSTESVTLRTPPRLDLRAGPGGVPFNLGAWAASAAPLSGGTVQDHRARYEVPVNGWPGQEIVFAVRAIGPSGRDLGWSNQVVVGVIPPPAEPAAPRAEVVPEGVRLTFEGQAPRFRVYRRLDDEKEFRAVADAAAPSWTDAGTQYGKIYHYRVESLLKTSTGREAESELSAETRITPADVFPPQVPSGLTAVVSTASIELMWDRNTEADLAGYRVYRAAPGAEFTRLAETGETPSYSDRNLEQGKLYRYSITALDQAGNESKMSAPVEATP
jgi:hypothetical protein